MKSEYEGGRLSDVAYEDERNELEAEIEDIMMKLKLAQEGKRV
ncbi:MAG: hypothetical protein ACFFEA_11840 [Candidatus Thorarchaeota archaeon]